MRPVRDSERLKKCFRCQQSDTHAISYNEDEGRDVVYYGWCNTCDKPYHYRLRVETVEDKKGRI